jgi:exodeoxyribonuclease VIII
MAAQVWEVDNATYHADMSKIGSSMLATILNDPTEYYRRYVGKAADGNPLEPHKQTEALLLGSLLHCLVLEPDKYDALYAVEPEGIDRRTNAGKEAAAAHALASIGKETVPYDLDQQARGMALSIRNDAGVQELMDGGIYEQPILWDETFPAVGDLPAVTITCKCKADILVPLVSCDHNLLLDIKSDKEPGPSNFLSPTASNSIRKYYYHMRLHHYTRGLLALTGKPCRVGLIVVGKEEPFHTFLYEITGWMEVGEMHWHEAMRRVREGMATGAWKHPCQGRVNVCEPVQWDLNPPVGYGINEEESA